MATNNTTTTTTATTTTGDHDPLGSSSPADQNGVPLSKGADPTSAGKSDAEAAAGASGTDARTRAMMAFRWASTLLHALRVAVVLSVVVGVMCAGWMSFNVTFTTDSAQNDDTGGGAGAGGGGGGGGGGDGMSVEERSLG